MRDDSSLLLLQADKSGDLDEVSLPDEVVATKWRSGCIYHDKHRAFASNSAQNGADTQLILFAVNMDYKLSVGLVPTLIPKVLYINRSKTSRCSAFLI